METMILCKLDNKIVMLKHLSRHLKIYHKKDYIEYISENLNDFIKFGWNKCPYTNKIIKGKVSPEFKHQYHSDVTKGIPKGPMKEETKLKLSESKMGEKHVNYGKKLGPLSNETKLKISKANKGKQFWLGKRHSQESKNKMSNLKIEHYKTNIHPMLGKTHSIESIKKIFSHRKMNKLEKIVADELDKNNIKYYFQFFINGNIAKSYDFKIKDKSILIEIDGNFWHGNPNTKNHFNDCDKVKYNDKIKEELALQNGYKLLRFWESDIKRDSSIIIKSLHEYLLA
jgi:very-short-patch-repair endonuclease